MNDKIIFKNSKVIDNTTKGPLLPDSEQIEYGEICINYKKGYERISFKNDNGNIVEIPDWDLISDKIGNAKREVFYQSEMPENGKNGDLWITPIII